MQAFTPLPGATSVSATASSVAGTITMPSLANALHIANTSATQSAEALINGFSASATLGAGLTIPPMSQVLVEANNTITHLAAIGSGAGPTAVVFTPARVQA